MSTTITDSRLLNAIETLLNSVYQYSEENHFLLFKKCSFELQQIMLAEALEIINENL